MTITRSGNNGGEYDSTLLGLFHLTFTRVSPAPPITLVLDCGIGDCDEMVFSASGASWTLVGGPANWQPSQLDIDPLPPGVDVDADGDGVPDGILTIGRSNFQVGVKFVGGGGGGGGGEGECDGTDHINGQSKIETHTSFLAGDSDADGKPNDCDDCTDVNPADGQDDFGGCGCDNPPEDCDEPDVEPHEPVEPAEPVPGQNHPL